jgi:hypothetical protein
MSDLDGKINESILETNTAIHGSEMRMAIIKYETAVYARLLEMEGKKADRTDSQLSTIALVISIIALVVNVVRALLMQ